MKRAFLLATWILFSTVAAVAAESPASQPPKTDVSKPRNKAVVVFKIDPLSPEQIQAGLSMEEIKTTVQNHLQTAGIQIDDSIAQPVLLLRIRTIESGFDYISFLQLSLQEESMLVRNRSIFNATTWSQASMLNCRPEDFKQEISSTITMMLETFESEYKKSLEL